MPFTTEEKTYGIDFDLSESDKKISTLFEGFKQKIILTEEKESLTKIVVGSSLALWKQASQKIKQSTASLQDKDNWNDEALYRARLKMRVFLKEQFPKKEDKALLENLIELLEDYSRGRKSIQFDKDAPLKILVSGFDPFKGMTSNISGVTALYLSGKKIAGAAVQGVIFPVRYDDFDQNVVEEFFEPYINEVDAILTISYTHMSDNIDIDRFSANVREGFPDNNQKSVKGKIMADAHNFYQTSLPFKEMIGKELRKPNQKVFFNQSWESENDKTAANKFPSGPSKAEGWNWVAKKTSLAQANKSGTPIQGAGGSYLSNEIHYRVSKLRIENKPKMPQGHLHIKDVADKKQFMADMEEAITRLIKSIN